MEHKRSGVGIIAGIVVCILFLYDIAVDVAGIISHPSGMLDIRMTLWWLKQIAESSVSVFLMISLFTERRSWLLIMAHAVNAALFFWQIAAMVQENGLGVLLSVTFLMATVSLLLRTVMVVFCSIPALREMAGWTGMIWFLPPVLSCILTIVSVLNYPKEYWENFVYHPLWITFQLSLNVLSVLSVLLFCLWLTEPVRRKKAEY